MGNYNRLAVRLIKALKACRFSIEGAKIQIVTIYRPIGDSFSQREILTDAPDRVDLLLRRNQNLLIVLRH